jgi:hypothetical protein
MAAAGAAGASGGARQQNPPAADKRIVEAIIRAVYRWDSFILKYDWIADELRALVSSGEYEALEAKMYELIASGEVKNVRMIYFHPDSIGDSVVAVSPCTLTEKQWRELEDLADLYGYAGYEDPTAHRYSLVVKSDRPSLDLVLHNLIRAWCVMTYADSNAYAAYSAFFNDKLLEKKFNEIVEDIEP